MDACWSRYMKGVGGSPLLTLTGFVLGAFSLVPNSAAACSFTGTSIVCNTAATTLAPNNVLSSTNGLSMAVSNGGSVSPAALPILSPAVALTGTNVSLSNQGNISSTLLGLVSVGTTAVRMASTTATGNVNVQNGGQITGTGLVSAALLSALDGAALDLRGGLGSTITLDNTASGVIGSSSILSIGVLSDSPTIIASGGARVNASNAGVITGRVGLGTSAGNSFINRGHITGSVHMGVNSSNTFTNVVGSSVAAGSGIGVSILGPAGTGSAFAAADMVDGGAGGNNSLVLCNTIDGDTSASGAGTVNAANYINFQNLLLNSGTWTLLGGPIASAATTLAGGTAIFNTSDTFGANVLTANGGTIQAGISGLNLANTVVLNGAGLTTNTGNSFTLSGAVSGLGALNKLGTHTLTGNNSYSGGTLLSDGSLVVGSVAALGTGPLIVAGNASLSSSLATTLSNAVNLSATLTLPSTQAVGLTGTISGTGNLVKNGGENLTLSGANTYTGGTNLNAGTLILGNNAALGVGVLTVGGAASMATSGGALTIANNVSLNNQLTVQVIDDLAITGNLSGGARLVKQGAGVLTLTGNSSYTGSTAVSAGELRVGANTALGTGQLIAADGVRLSSSTATNLSNVAQLNGTLNIVGDQNLAMSGTLVGTSGSIVKTGQGILTLTGDNTFGSTAPSSIGVILNGGTLAVGSTAALGDGSLQVRGVGVLTGTANVALPNAIDLGANLTVSGANTLGRAGTISGSGKLIKQDVGNLVLTTTNTYVGGTQLLGGMLTVGATGALGAGELVVDGLATLGASTSTSITNSIDLNAGLRVATRGNALTLDGPVTGSGGLHLADGGTLILTGTNTFVGGTTLSAGRLVVNNAATVSAGPLTVAGAASLSSLVATTLTNAVALNDFLTLDGTQDLTLAGAISGTGTVTLNGTSTLTLSGNNTFTGGMSIISGTLETLGSNALADNVVVSVAPGARLRLTDSETFGSLTGAGSVELGAQAIATLGANNNDSIFAGDLLGAGSVVKTGIGTLTLSGSNNDHTGNITTDSDRLTVNGGLASANVGISAGATLAGSGTLAGAVTVAADSVLQLQSGQTLGMGSLTLAENAKIHAYLGSPTTTELASVSGNLTLDGDLNIYDVGDFGVGVYRLFQYGGQLTDKGLGIGVLPEGFLPGQLVVQTSIDTQVNLMVQNNNPDGLQFWNGAQVVASGSIIGGAGTWQQNRTNWTDKTGALTQSWQGVSGVFGGTTAGTVTLVGEQNVDGLQFFTDGYTLAGAGTLSLTNANTIVRVDPNNTATINVAVTGAGGLNKRDTGILILSGNNSYASDTTLSEGVLQVDADNRLGQGVGALTFNGGTLRIAGNTFGSTARNITWGGTGGGFDVTTDNHTFTVTQNLTGAGNLTKAGSGLGAGRGKQLKPRRQFNGGHAARRTDRIPRHRHIKRDGQRDAGRRRKSGPEQRC
jgi:autotransporter-associated beta strand protein